ncbi:hypothetical protein [Pseudomonas sp. TMP25]|uniref:hypothetical protein n=1 Tax=Pseudomonas sp. TMP25 TaxID=3136561 RepID=UPI0031012790
MTKSKFSIFFGALYFVSFAYAGCSDARVGAIQSYQPDRGEVTNHSGNITSSSGERYTYSGRTYTQPNHYGNVANAFAVGMAASKAEQDCLSQQREMERAPRAASYDAGFAHLRMPPNAIDTNERASITQHVSALGDRLPVSIYSHQSSASPEVAFIRDGASVLTVLGETEGMFKVSTSQGVIGWVGKNFVEPVK